MWVKVCILGGKDALALEERQYAPLGAGVQYEYILRLHRKWGAPVEPLAFQVLAYSHLACSGGVSLAFPGWGGSVELVELCRSVGHILHDLEPGSQLVLECS